MIALINPTAANWRFRIPLSVLSLGGSLEGSYAYEIVDGNIRRNLLETLPTFIQEKGIKYVGLTVMPGPQLVQAIHLSKLVRARFPNVKIIWGGYFPSLHSRTVLQSGYVDFVISGQGEFAFKQLIDSCERGGSLSSISGLSYKNGEIRNNSKQDLIDPNELPPLPYSKVSIPMYVGRTFLGSRTINYHSSVGCPFLCGFCAVAAIYKARWLGLTAERMTSDLLWFKKHYAVNAVEFHDNNFFTSEKRVFEFADRIKREDISWWGEARPDTTLDYDEKTWRLMKKAGLKMVFFGAESSSESVLQLMHKGGTQTPDTVLTLAEKMREADIIPEFSFVLGNPTGNVTNDVDKDIRFIKQVKKINPRAEIIIYTYSPVFFEEAELFHVAQTNGFAYPEKLDDWLKPEWQRHDLRKNPVTPWLTANHHRLIKGFERVLNARYPTVSDLKLSGLQRTVLQMFGSWRYKFSLYAFPYELAALQKFFRYRQPEIEGL
ncbi:MAG: B12-binding domain-containing radical SAM protein [Ignavibacteriales bacterium]|nr:B12-binding domain-containing radical SAM protein [Ignavibacteriales bacterium]